MNLERLLNLRFLNEPAATNDRNLKFAAPIRIKSFLADFGRAALAPKGKIIFAGVRLWWTSQQSDVIRTLLKWVPRDPLF
jgi:hypothetical protein